MKTKNYCRNIAIGADTIEVLKEMEQKDEYVFLSPYGGSMSPDSVLHMLQRVLKRAGLERMRFHDLRHTFSALALQNGVDVKILSAMLGHYSAGFTLDTYAHVTTSMQKRAALLIVQVTGVHQLVPDVYERHRLYLLLFCHVVSLLLKV